MYVRECPQCPQRANVAPVAGPGFGIPLPWLGGRIGAGDAVALLTDAAGILPCSPCAERQAWLNQHLYFRPWSGLSR
jgi:hypothetical protein